MDGGTTITPEQHELVRTLARRAIVELGIRAELSELESCGVEGLLLAKKRFDPSRGVPLERFAYYRIRGAIRDGIRQMTRLPRRAYESLSADEHADRAMENDAEVSVERPTDGDFEAGAMSLDDLMGQVAAAHIATAAANVHATSEESLITQLDGKRLRAVVETLPDRPRHLIQLLYFEEKSFDQAGEELKISKSQAFRVHGEALSLLREKLS